MQAMSTSPAAPGDTSCASWTERVDGLQAGPGHGCGGDEGERTREAAGADGPRAAGRGHVLRRHRRSPDGRGRGHAAGRSVDRDGRVKRVLDRLETTC